jgi:hypothetical protein
MSQPQYPPFGSQHGSQPAIAPYGPPPAPQQQQPPGQRPKWLIPAIAGGGALVLLIVVGVVLVLVLRGGRKGLPFDAKRLPPQTYSVNDFEIDATREHNEKVKTHFLAAYLAGIVCGRDSPDRIVAQLEAGPSLAETILRPKSLERMKTSLECGQMMSKSLGNNYVTQYRWEEDEKTTHRAVALRLSMDEMPAKYGWVKQKIGSKDGFCRPKEALSDDEKPVKEKDEKETAECKDESTAALRDGKNWFFGDKKGLEQLARAIEKPRDELSTTVEHLVEAAGATEGLDRRMMLARIDKDFKALDLVSQPCAWAASGTVGSNADFRKLCFPMTVEKQLQAFEGKLRSVAVEADDDLEVAGAIRGNLILVARDPEAAKDIEKDLKEVAREWKAHVETNETKLVKQAKDKPTSREEKVWSVAIDPFIRAIKKMDVSRSGRAVKLRFEEKFKDAEKKEIKESIEKFIDKELIAADLLEQISKEGKISQQVLAKITGAKWAEYLLIPKVQLSKDDCEKIQSNLKQVSCAEVTEQGARTLCSMMKYGKCVNDSVTEPVKACLLEAKEASSFKCKPPEEPSRSDYGTKKDKDKDDDDDEPKKAGGSIGVKECDEYVRKMEACLGKMDKDKKALAEPVFKAKRDAFTRAASTPETRGALAPMCQAAIDSMDSSCK